MAIINDPFLKNVHGKLGNAYVIRQVNGKTVISLPPTFDKTKATELQLERRDKFRDAVRYAKAITALPKMKKIYLTAMDKKFSSAYSAAKADAMSEPKVHAVDITDYNGTPGSIITIDATDDFAVVRVEVTITDGNGNRVEKGLATREIPIGSEWIYKATALNENLPGSKIFVEAKDLPGGEGRMVVEM